MQVIPFLNTSIPHQDTWLDPDANAVIKLLTSALKDDMNGGIKSQIMTESGV